MSIANDKTIVEYYENDSPKAILIRVIKAMETDRYSRYEIKKALSALSENYNLYEDKNRYKKLWARGQRNDTEED